MRPMAALLCALWLTPASAPQEIYDLLIQGGHVIDPKNQRSERLDVAVTAGTIRNVARDIPAAHARRVIPARGYYVTPVTPSMVAVVETVTVCPLAMVTVSPAAGTVPETHVAVLVQSPLAVDVPEQPLQHLCAIGCHSVNRCAQELPVRP